MKRTICMLSALLLLAAVVGRTTEMDDDFNQHAPQELKHFAFWLGLWEFETQMPDGEGNMVNVKGTNRISLTFDGYGLHEDFNMGSGKSQFSGGSVTCVNPKTKEFVQVWVDNSGWHKTFIGTWHEDQQAMILYGPEEEIKGKLSQRRLVWKDITDKTMVWSYELSQDGGETWKPTWVLNYKRVEELQK